MNKSKSRRYQNNAERSIILEYYTDKGPMTIEEISNEIICDTTITDLLNKLKRVKVVGFINI